MDETIKNLAALRKREHSLIQKLVKVNAEICAALSDAVKAHGPTLGVSDAVMAASTAPKDD